MPQESSPLFPASHANAHICALGAVCPEAVVEIAGRFFITGSHGNFNSQANNGLGYSSPARARAAIRAVA